MNLLKKKYNEKVVPELMKRFEYKNIHEVPKLEMISVNMGVGEATEDKKLLDGAIKDMTAITGRKPALTKSRKAISNFKLRAGIPIGCKVTLRDITMYEFLDRLVSLTIPRIRDFNGLSPESFDGRGNYSMGIKEQTVFPEIDYDKVDKIRGLNINIKTSARNDEEGRELLRLLGVPFKKK